MLPTSAVSGFYFGHRDSQYFGVARIGRDQLEEYAARRGVDDRAGRALAAAEPRLEPSSAARLARGQARCFALAPRSVLLSLLLLALARSRQLARERDRARAGRRRAGAARRRGRARDPHAHQARLARLLAEPGRCRPADGRAMAAAARASRSAPLRYPVPSRLTVAGLDELCLRARLCGAGAAEGAGGRARHDADPRRGALARLHRQGLRARAGRAFARPAGRQRARPTARSSTNGGARCRGRWRRSAHFAVARRQAARRHPAAGERRRSASPISSRSTDGAVDYAAPQASAARATR